MKICLCGTQRPVEMRDVNLHETEMKTWNFCCLSKIGRRSRNVGKNWAWWRPCSEEGLSEGACRSNKWQYRVKVSWRKVNHSSQSYDWSKNSIKSTRQIWHRMWKDVANQWNFKEKWRTYLCVFVCAEKRCDCLPLVFEMLI